MDRLIGIHKNLKKIPNRNYTTNYVVNTLKIVEELKCIALENEGYPLEIINDIEIQILNHLKIKEIKDMTSFGIHNASKIMPECLSGLDQISNLLAIIKYYAETLKDDTEISRLIKFVLATKLADKDQKRY